MTDASLAPPQADPSRKLRFGRVLLKISGEALMGDGAYGIDMPTADRIAAEVAEAVRAGVEVCLVIGGGNIFRGLTGAAKGMERASLTIWGCSPR